MFFEEERKVIESHFQTEWELTSFSGIQVNYPNIPFSTKGLDQFIKLDLLSGEGAQISLGGDARFRWAGIVQCGVFTLVDIGSSESKQMADKIGEIWFRKELPLKDNGRILFEVPSITVLGPRRGWYRLEVSTPFFRELFLTQAGSKVTA